MISFDIRNRFSGDVQFTAKIDCKKPELTSVKIGLAVLWAVKTDADLRYANLQSANLQSADLRYANLQSANLQSADLQSADLRYADLQSANLQSANLQSADLRYANLRYANLQSADLRYANLQSADLQYTNLQSADLRYANLQSASYGKARITIAPIMIYGLIWDVLILDDWIKIGCEFHSLGDWCGFDNDRIESMGGRALEFWQENKAVIIQLAENHRPEQTK